jgi:uncharacterized protein YjbJ (UPF0337 family)
MSDVSSGARAPDGGYSDQPVTPAADPAYPGQSYPTETYATETYPAQTYPAETYPAETYPATTGSSGDDQSKARQVAGQAKDVAGQAAGDVKDTAKEQVQRVGSEARMQARNVASDVRDRVSQQARSQNDKLVSGIRQAADQLEEMRGDRQDSPAATVVSRIADSGRQFADYLDHHGPEGVLREVQDFARRRPGAFLATALAAGFVVGRLGKGVAKADEGGSSFGGGSTKPRTDAFVSTDVTPAAPVRPGYADPAIDPAPGYSATTEYASTGTGTPVVVDEEYPGRRP